QQPERGIELVAGQQPDRLLDLVPGELQPQLRRLMDGGEKELVTVGRRLGVRLQREQLIRTEVALVVARSLTREDRRKIFGLFRSHEQWAQHTFVSERLFYRRGKSPPYGPGPSRHAAAAVNPRRVR